MMQDVIFKLLERVPEMTALIVVVVAFLKFTRSLLATHMARTSEFVDTVKELASVNEVARRHNGDVIERNTAELARMAEVQRRNTEATEQMTLVLREFVVKQGMK